jgi:hypothetical protein
MDKSFHTPGHPLSIVLSQRQFVCKTQRAKKCKGRTLCSTIGSHIITLAETWQFPSCALVETQTIPPPRAYLDYIVVHATHTVLPRVCQASLSKFVICHLSSYTVAARTCVCSPISAHLPGYGWPIVYAGVCGVPTLLTIMQSSNKHAHIKAFLCKYVPFVRYHFSFPPYSVFIQLYEYQLSLHQSIYLHWKIWQVLGRSPLSC